MKNSLLMLMMSITFTANAQNASVTVPSSLKEAQMSAFGSKNKEAQQQSAQVDSVAKAQAAQAAKVEKDTDPEFPGGQVFLDAYLKKKLLHSGVSGKGEVVVSFKVDKKGNIYGAEVTKSAGSTLDTAAFNIVTGMPRWRPGLTNGVPADKPASVTVSFGQN